MSNVSNTFEDFNLSKQVLKGLSDLGYEAPSPVQSEGIPVLLKGRDLIAQAQTGTGKTGAFALPVLEQLNLKQTKPQVLVLAPTRELAIQVSEAFQSYAKYLTGFHVVPIYGGQGYDQQLRALKRGVHVVVGTPGRVMDHIRRKTLALDNIQMLVLDEADEMLRMGFLEDVKWILEQMPHKHQTALFSATMPESIKQVAKKYLNDPVLVKIKSKTMTAANIKQSAMLVSNKNKLEALTRYLEVEEFDGIIIFARTKRLTAELADRLAARGYSAAALNGDMSQSARERVIERVKKKKLDVIVATDVAARGLDVERLSHVINYDAPYDAETYVHRIGRTGRAGRQGKSLLLLAPREQNYLRTIERTTNQPVEVITPPTSKEVSELRMESFMSSVINTLKSGQLDYYREMVERISHQAESSELDIAAALVKMLQKKKPIETKGDDKELMDATNHSDDSGRRKKPRRSKGGSGYSDKGKRRSGGSKSRKAKSSDGPMSSRKPKSSGKPKKSSSKPKRRK